MAPWAPGSRGLCVQSTFLEDDEFVQSWFVQETEANSKGVVRLARTFTPAGSRYCVRSLALLLRRSLALLPLSVRLSVCLSLFALSARARALPLRISVAVRLVRCARHTYLWVCAGALAWHDVCVGVGVGVGVCGIPGCL